MAKCESPLSITFSLFPCSSTFLSLPKVALHAHDRCVSLKAHDSKRSIVWCQNVRLRLLLVHVYYSVCVYCGAFMCVCVCMCVCVSLSLCVCACFFVYVCIGVCVCGACVF